MVPIYRTRFDSFADFAFRELYPGEKMKDNWHIRLMANVLQFSAHDFGADVCRKLVFNAPPGYMKTHVCSISFPAWILGRDPRRSVLIVSETPEAARDIQEQCMTLMSTRRYRAVFPRVKIRKHHPNLELTYGGGIRHCGVGQSLPQRKSDLVVFDNPQSLHSMERLRLDPFLEVARSLKDPKQGLMVLASRRLAADDLSDFLHRKCGWAVLALPAVGLTEKTWGFLPGVSYVQRQGEPLYPYLEWWDEIEGHLAELGGLDFSFQYLQGLFRPQTSGQRPGGFSDGYRVMMVGTFDPTAIMAEELERLKNEYISYLTAIAVPVRMGSAGNGIEGSGF